MRQCSQVFALIEADRASVLHNIGEDGYKLCTSNVRDVLAPDDTTTYDLTAFCTLKNLQDFKLDPPRGTKKQNVVIAHVFLLRSVAQPVGRDHASMSSAVQSSSLRAAQPTTKHYCFLVHSHRVLHSRLRSTTAFLYIVIECCTADYEALLLFGT